MKEFLGKQVEVYIDRPIDRRNFMDERRIHVRLKVDLTKYMEDLVAGTDGYTVGSYGMWSRASDRFIGVNFPGIGTLDVLWESLEIIDEDYLKELEERKGKELDALKSAKNVVKYIGPKGGFRCLSYEYIGSDGIRINASNGSRQDSERLIKLFEVYWPPIIWT